MAACAAVLIGVSLCTTAFASPDPSPSGHHHPHPSGSPSGGPLVGGQPIEDWAWHLTYAQAKAQPSCTPLRLKNGNKGRVCFRTSPSKTPKMPAWSKIHANKASPRPPGRCRPAGTVHYDRFHACQEGTATITVDTPEGQATGEFQTDVWYTLSNKNPTWLMQVGITVGYLDPRIVQAGPNLTTAIICSDRGCKTSRPQREKLAPFSYEYYEIATRTRGPLHNRIRYANPQALGIMDFDNAVARQPVGIFNVPFDIRCDGESYIGGEGCVNYLGYSAIPIYFIGYNGPFAAVAQNDLYGAVVRDTAHHYGDIQFGNPLHRADPITQNNNRGVACPPAIVAKASALGLSCDEYPYASSGEGASNNPLYSCAFVPLDQNRNQGNDLNNKVFRPQRILPALHEGGRYIQGDGFWVWVLGAPSQIPTVKQCSQY